MVLKAAIVGSVLAGLAQAAQPGAASPVAAPMRDLDWGKLNILHTTDTHGWHGGHLKESQYSADWGDYISFAEHLRKLADEKGIDLLLVDTGDRVEGNGLYDASSPKGKYYYDIYREQDIDIICTGNHELYQAPTADEEHRQTVPNFKNTYLASNLDYIDPLTGERMPMAQRYRKFQTKNQKLDIVAFGFIFDFTVNANNTVVQPVEETIKEQWFQDAIREKADVFVVIGHVGLRMQEFKDIFTAIRDQNWFTPIVFLGGHAHIRDATAYDSNSIALASGRYFETIGFLSVDGDLKRSFDVPSSSSSLPKHTSFSRRYIDNNLLGLYHHTGLNETTFPTEHGRNVTAIIARARKELDLDYNFGCAPKDLWMTRAPYPDDNSIYTWLETEVLPDVAVNADRSEVPRLVILNTGAIRFDIFKGAFTRDTTYIVSPFTSTLSYIPDVPYEVARKVIILLNRSGPIFHAAMADSSVPDVRFMGIPEQFDPTTYSRRQQQQHASDSASDFGSSQQKPLFNSNESPMEPALVEGYTTEDDIGNDGDDAVHSVIDFYAVPNCIQTEIGVPEGEEDKPDSVDLVFVDFIQPWVLLALKFSGGEQYGNKDVRPFIDGKTFTELMEEWIKKNWRQDCS
ncbi:Metallo-dependent phosphatase-like protein [Apodospora peruviana]|uniref:Metallo-dependent phosphatase-like protein n=1 Tax=Apodospora peruviana TaxID=516989 RepID=A0AAE0MFM7_9PEZI|nr:Metallo-dependent phosphatase-like protein [Apodospora peruviana]